MEPGLYLLLLLLVVAVSPAVAIQENRPQEVPTPESVKRLLYAAVNKDDVQTFASLIDRASQPERDGFLLYVLRQSKKSPIEFVRVLLENGANVNQPTRYKTALIHASSEGHADIVSLLLARGAQVNAETDEGTALIEAVKGGHTEIVKLQIAAGADVKVVHRTGEQALMMAARQRSYRTPTVEPNAEILQMLLAPRRGSQRARKMGRDRADVREHRGESETFGSRRSATGS